MAKSVGKVVISFGMVSVPVKLYSTGNSASTISFNQLSPEGGKLKQQYIDPTQQDPRMDEALRALEKLGIQKEHLPEVLRDRPRVVAHSEMKKGYEYAKGQYVTFDKKEIDALKEPPNQTLTVQEFVPVQEIPIPVRFKTYYLIPDTGGVKAYSLLARAMLEMGRCGLASFAVRGKQYLVSIEPHEGGLALHQLYYKDEIVDFETLGVEIEDVSDEEVDMACKLIDFMTNDYFEPGKYEDGVKRRMEAAIEQKINGEKIVIPEHEENDGAVGNLLDCLKASLSEPIQEAA